MGTDLLADVIEAFAPDRRRIYLDAATYGLPPTATVRALRRAITAWQKGHGRWMEDWDVAAESCRSSFAELVGVDASEVATVPTVSVAVGMVAASLADGDEVVVPANEFTSVLYPLLVAEQRGVRIRQVTLSDIPDAIGPETSLVATSLVQMQTGLAAPIGDIVGAARRHGARILLDVTQAVPVAPILDGLAGDIDYIACAGYKHLLSPRGTGYLVVRRSSWDTLAPIDANWRAADDPYGRYFGGPLRLAPGAARFDVSHAWFSWVGARESLRLLVEWKRSGALGVVRRHARRLADGLGLPDPGTTLVCVAVSDDGRLGRALRGARIRCAMRGDSLRLAPHVYTTTDEIDRAIEVIRPFVGRGDA